MFVCFTFCYNCMSLKLNWLYCIVLTARKKDTRGWPGGGHGHGDTDDSVLTACIRLILQCGGLLLALQLVVSSPLQPVSLCFLCFVAVLSFPLQESGQSIFSERVLPVPLSPWLGGVRLKRNCCAFSIRWNYRCVRGGVLLLCASCQSWCHFPRVWAPLLCFVWTWWGIFDSANRETNKDVVGHYFFFFFPLLSSLLFRSRTIRFLSQRDFPMIWRLRNALSSAR